MDGLGVSGKRTLTHTFDSEAPAGDFWAVYTDVSAWDDWTPEIKWATIQGRFEPGATGLCKFKGLPKTRFAVGRVVEPRRFVTTMDFRFARLEFDHILEPHDRGVRVTEEITFCGPLGVVFAWLQRRRVKRTWPEAMRTLESIALSRRTEPRGQPVPSP